MSLVTSDPQSRTSKSQNFGATTFSRMIFEGVDQSQRALDSEFVPPLAPGETLVAISLATICGSDLHTVDGRRPAPTPCVLGHEAVGTITAVGSGGNPARIGRRVTWTLADSCGTCLPCTTWDLPQKCQSLFKYGHATLHDG